MGAYLISITGYALAGDGRTLKLTRSPSGTSCNTALVTTSQLRSYTSRPSFKYVFEFVHPWLLVWLNFGTLIIKSVTDKALSSHEYLRHIYPLSKNMAMFPITGTFHRGVIEWLYSHCQQWSSTFQYFTLIMKTGHMSDLISSLNSVYGKRHA